MSSAVPSSSDAVDLERRSAWQLVSWIVAGLCAGLATTLSLCQIRAHQKRFSSPHVQRKIISILWIVPIYSINSWLSLRYVHASVYIDAFRDVYEAYVLHMFLSLMFTYLCSPDGNPSRMDGVIELLDNEHKTINHMFPFKYWFSPWDVDRDFLKICYRGTLQFCFFKPFMTIVAVLLEANGMYDEGSFDLSKGYIYVSIVMNCSITWAAYVLLLFYLAFKTQLAPYSPVPKFLCIKAVLFLSFWQSVVLAGLARFQFIHDVGEYTSSDVKTGINNALLCLEMVMIAVGKSVLFSLSFAFSFSFSFSFSSSSSSSSSCSIFLFLFFCSIVSLEHFHFRSSFSFFQLIATHFPILSTIQARTTGLWEDHS